MATFASVTPPAYGLPARSSFSPGTQLNWLARYIPLKPHLGEAALKSLLEVGSGSHGLSCALAETAAGSFVGIDTQFAGAPASSMTAIVYGGGKLPFKSGAFHTVVSMDTLEHVPPQHRAGFLEELTRVASARVLLGFPIQREGGADARHAELFLQALFRALGMGSPDWLREHEELGLPSAADAEAIFNRLPAWSWRPLATTGNLVNLMAVLIDVLPGTGSWVAPLLEKHAPELETWLRAGAFGPTDRAVYSLDKREPSAPIVALTPGQQLSRSLVRGISCPDCEGDLDLFEPRLSRLICTKCQRLFSRGPNGEIHLQAFRTRLTFYLAPDWAAAAAWMIVVRNYLAAFPADAPCRLWLDVDPARVALAQAVAILQPALGAFGDRPFAEIYLNDNLRERPRGDVVALAGAAGAERNVEWFKAQARNVEARNGRSR